MTKSLIRPFNPLNLSPASLLSYLPWLALLGWLSSIAWFLCDDALISFRYTRNLLEGHGLVYNPGEYVEGYTNFLWILELAAIWGIFGLRPEHAAPWLSVAYTIATIAAMLWWVARLPSLPSRGLVGWMALGLLCSSATFAVWTSSGGLETRQFTFFIVTAVVCLSLYAKSRAGLLTASFSLAAAELTRPEGLLPSRLLLRLVRPPTPRRRKEDQRQTRTADRLPCRALRNPGRRSLPLPLRLLRANGSPTPTTPNTSDLGTSPASATSRPPPWRPDSISCCPWPIWPCTHAGRPIAMVFTHSCCSLSSPTWPISSQSEATSSSIAPSTSTGPSWPSPQPKASRFSALG